MIIINGVACTTEEELEAAIAEFPEDQKLFHRNDFWGAQNPTYSLEDASKLAVKKVIQDAMAFGDDLLAEFGAENVLLGITQMGLTGDIRRKTAEVLLAVKSGSLRDAIFELRAIPQSDWDSTFITEVRLLKYINKIEVYLGMELSTTL